MAKISQQIGAHGQSVGTNRLRMMGAHFAQEIATPVSLRPYHAVKNVYHVAWKRKVSGDHTAILAGGLYVLAETKTYTNGNLPYSALEDHQRLSLSNHAKAGGLALLIWVSDSGAYVMEWGCDGIDGFNVPRTSITTKQAEQLDSDLVTKLEQYEERIGKNPISLWDGKPINLAWLMLNG